MIGALKVFFEDFSPSVTVNTLKSEEYVTQKIDL